MKPNCTFFFALFLLFNLKGVYSQTYQKTSDIHSNGQILSQTESQAYQTFREKLILKPNQNPQSKTSAASCSSGGSSIGHQNIGFELGNFSGWNLQKGTILNSLYDSIINLAPITSTYVVMNGGTDILSGVSLLSPFTGSYCIMLNDQLNNVEATQLSAKFRVTPSNTILKTAFALIMQKSYHDCEGQPYFRIQVFSCSRSNLIEEYLIMGDESTFCSGFNTTLINKNTPGLSTYNITDWKKACFDLRNYVGEEVEVNVIMADCKYSGHYGYGFFDAEFGSLPASYAASTSFSVNGAAFNFNGTVGNQCFAGGSVLQCQNASSIVYSIANWSNSVAVTHSVILSGSGYYNMIQSPLPGCDLLNEQFIPVEPTVAIAVPGGTYCPNAYYTATLSGAKDYTLKINGVQTQTVQNSFITNAQVGFLLTQNPGTITVIGSGGPNNCLDSSSIVVQLHPQTSLTVAYTPTICAGAVATFSALGALTYTWNTSAAFTQTFATTVFGTSQFNVQGTDGLGCKTSVSSFSVQGIYGTTISYSLPSTSSLCEGDSVLCSFSGATSFTWSNGFTGASQYLKPTAANPNYSVSASALCSNTQTYNFNYFVLQGPALTTFTVNHPNTAICPGSSFTVQGLGTNFYFKYGNSGAYTNIGNYSANASIPSFIAIAQSTNGCGTKSIIPMSYLSSPTLAISGSTLLCPGQVGSFTATGANTYTWNYTQSSTQYTTLPSNTSYSVILNGLGLNGCASTSVFPIPVENGLITASSNSANLCIGANTLSLQAQAFVTSGTYFWNTGASTQSILVTPTISTVYTLTTNSALCGIKISTIAVSVNPNTVTPISVTVSPVCLGKVYTVTAAGASTYQFSYFSPTTSNTFTALATFTQAQYFSVNGTASNGCVTSSTFSFSAAPLVSLNTSSFTNHVMCLNGQITMTVGGANSYSWNTGATGSLITVSPPVTTNYSVVGTSPNGCPTNSLGLTVTVLNPPTVTLSPASLIVCPNSVFNINASAGPGYYLTQWSDGSTGSQLTSSVSAATMYTVNMSNNICNVTQSVFVNVYNPTVLNIMSSTYCTGNPNTISYTATPPGGTLFVNNFPGNSIYANTAAIYTVTYKYQDTGLCVLSTHSLITVNVSPCVKLTADQYSVCEGNQITFTGTPLGGNYFGTNASPNVLSPSLAGTYSVSYTYVDGSGCAGTACLEVMADVCSGVGELTLAAIKIYPNPTEEQVIIENTNSEQMFLKIYTINGSLMYTDLLKSHANTISLKEYPKGIYIFQIQTKSDVKFLKVIRN